MAKAYKIRITGLVQGVGFRPFIYKLAIKNNIHGWVENRTDGVIIHAEKQNLDISALISEIRITAPVASQINKIDFKETQAGRFIDFRIVKSTHSDNDVTEVCPDIAICDDCISDMSLQKHRLNYPFINCTNCGPRFSIISALPYDREKTSMSKFTMCSTCNSEYSDIFDRRFHAQPVACNTCGPSYSLYKNEFEERSFHRILSQLINSIDSGEIVALKGIGGFNLTCDAFNEQAVSKLRTRKHRDNKPFAVMFSDIENIKLHANVSPKEEEILSSWRRPIVILKQKPENSIATSVSKNLNTIGAFLPYMPLHYLLFEKLKTRAIVLTSGNISDEPIIIENDQALSKLSEIADSVITYDRDIVNRCDDSVVFVTNNRQSIIRRSRGFAPSPIYLKFNAENIFAAGGELKSTFCIGKNNQAILSQHIGDLKELSTYSFYKEAAERFFLLYKFKPELYVCDLHPDYLSSKYCKANNPVIAVQHHHAHIASCMAEHQLDEKVIGISFDGTGYGSDNNIWGGEFFVCDLLQFDRITHLEYIPAPGGDKANKEGWRMAVSYLYKYFNRDFLTFSNEYVSKLNKEKTNLLIQAIDNKINCPLTSSAGRLFDAVAALLDICQISAFEAEGAILLEQAANIKVSEHYSFEIADSISLKKMFEEIIHDIKFKTSVGDISMKFHNTLAQIILTVSEKIRLTSNINKVVLSGGVFQNKILCEKSEQLLLASGFEVYTQRLVPCNDGGLALGQLAIAAKTRMNRNQNLN